MTHDAVERRQATAAAGLAPRVRGRIGNGSGRELRQGAIRVVWGDACPAIHVPNPAPTSCRNRTGAGLHEHPMRDRAKRGPTRRPGLFPQGSSGKTVRRIAHRMMPEGELRGAVAGQVLPKKLEWQN